MCVVCGWWSVVCLLNDVVCCVLCVMFVVCGLLCAGLVFVVACCVLSVVVWSLFAICGRTYSVCRLLFVVGHV